MLRALSPILSGILVVTAAALSGDSDPLYQEHQTHRYITAPVERGRIASVVRATGTLNPISTVDVSSELSGRMAEVLVSFNDAVKAGQVLARLDQTNFAAKVREARAALRIAQAGVLMQRAALERAKAELTI